jgi:2-succinyl-6-hydroxy-2,4-cyclohexadiene-1-carboxylate synthase
VPPNLVLLHGFTNTAASWSEVVAALPERYRPLALDIRGHGAASDVRPVSLTGVVTDVSAETTSPFELVGYSMGGRLALHVALALPDRVRRLVLIGASPGIADPAARAERRGADERLADEVERMTIQEFAARWATTSVLADQPAAVRTSVGEQRLRNTPAGLAAALRGLGTGALPSLWERLAELTISVDLIVGDRDEKFRAIAERMRSPLARSRLHVIPDAGHAVHLERPVAVAEIIARHTIPSGLQDRDH